MRIHYLIYITIALISVSNSAIAQEIKIGVISDEITIQGRVLDASDKTPIVGVNVYLNNTTVGGTTNKNGYYSFKTTLTGAYSLIFSFIGYSKQAYAVQLGKNGSKSIKVDAQLKELIYEAGEVTVTGDNRKWRRNFTAFSRNFIGESDFADLTGIENFTVIEFNDENRNEFQAFSKEPLVIMNRALGYKVVVDLEEFEWNLRRRTGYYYTYQRFEELEPENDAERQIWDENRKKAYRGSLKHFLHSVYHDKVYSEGFTYRQTRSLRKAELQELTYHRTVKGIPENSGFVFYNLSRPISVMYTIDTNDLLTSRRVEESAMNPLRNNDIIGIDQHGNLYDPLSVQVAGAWSFYRIADQLPFDYVYQK